MIGAYQSRAVGGSAAPKASVRRARWRTSSAHVIPSGLVYSPVLLRKLDPLLDTLSDNIPVRLWCLNQPGAKAACKLHARRLAQRSGSLRLALVALIDRARTPSPNTNGLCGRTRSHSTSARDPGSRLLRLPYSHHVPNASSPHLEPCRFARKVQQAQQGTVAIRSWSRGETRARNARASRPDPRPSLPALLQPHLARVQDVARCKHDREDGQHHAARQAHQPTCAGLARRTTRQAARAGLIRQALESRHQLLQGFKLWRDADSPTLLPQCQHDPIV